MSSIVQINDTIRDNSFKITRLAIIVWAIGALFYAYENSLQVSPSVMTEDLMRSFAINATSMGYLTAAYFFVYAPMQIPVGLLLDRYGPRRLLLVAIGCCALGSYLFSQATVFALALVARALIGFGSAFALVGSFKLISNWFHPSRFAFFAGLALTLGMSGAFVGQAPLGMLVAEVGWRQSLLVYAVVGMLLVLSVLLLLRDHPDTKHQIDKTMSFDLLLGLKRIVRSSQSWIASVYASLMFAPTLILGGAWGIPFIKQTYGLTATQAGFLVSLVYIGWAIGSPIFGWLSDRIGRRLLPMYLASIVTLITSVAIIYIPDLPKAVIGTLLFIFGAFSSGFVMAFSLVREIHPHRYSATALGFINMLNMVGGMCLPPFAGYILDVTWHGEMLGDARIFSVHSYHLALAVVPIIIFISLLLLPLIKETYCKPVGDGDID